MFKYHFNIKLSNVRYNHAGSKAVEDCKTILLNSGFEDIEIPFVKKSYMMPLNLIKLFCLLIFYRYKIQPNSLIVVQYPLLGINRYFKYFAAILKAKKCKLACIVHDLDSIRSDDDGRKAQIELENLKVYDVIIAHNNAMKQWLVEQGYSGKIVLIHLFDYLVDDKTLTDCIKNNLAEVAFAGNLGRCKFLKQLSNIEGIKFNLYGPGLEESGVVTGHDVKWMGSFSPEEIVSKINGRFGLIWDGTSLDEYTGLMGHYLKYNTPHKTSLYLVSGLPVIVHKTAAIANYIKLNRLGMVVDDLSNLKSQLSLIDDGQYAEMKKNTLIVSSRLKNGEFLKAAVNQIVDSF